MESGVIHNNENQYKEMRQLIKLIGKGTETSKNIPSFINGITDIYYSYARYQFVIDYYNFYEKRIEENTSILPEQTEELTKQLTRIIGEVLDNKSSDELIDEIRDLRRKVVTRMEGIGAYTDIFSLHEYILNRMELRYQKLDPIDNDEVAREILQNIFAKQDNNEINSKIQLMLSQMPVRMTKAKFLQVLEDSLALYEGAEYATVEKFLYMVRSAAGLYQPDHMQESFPLLSKWEKELRIVDYKELKENDYQHLVEIKEEAGSYLNEITEFYMDMQEIINHLYAMVLTQQTASREAVAGVEDLNKIIKWAYEGFLSDEPMPVPEEMLDLFMMMEGALEVLYELILNSESTRDALLDQHEQTTNELGLTKRAELLVLCGKLISTSIFADLDEDDEIDLADKEYITVKTEELQRELEDFFACNNSKLNRAVMAAILKELPVFFSSRNEVMEYVRYSLDNCRDLSEKAISTELLLDAYAGMEGR